MAILRKKSFRVPLTEDEHRMLMAVAAHEGVQATVLVRQYIKREYLAFAKRLASPK